MLHLRSTGDACLYSTVGSVAFEIWYKYASETSYLYGGSCNASNAVNFFSQADVDGGLIGAHP